MIKREHYATREDGVELTRTYSDAGLMIRKVGTKEVYEEAVDVKGAGYQYEETDTPVDTYEDLNKEEV